MVSIYPTSKIEHVWPSSPFTTDKNTVMPNTKHLNCDTFCNLHTHTHTHIHTNLYNMITHPTLCSCTNWMLISLSSKMTSLILEPFLSE